MLGEMLTHQSDGNRYGTLAVHTRNNQEVYCHFQSQGEVMLDGVLIYQNRGSHYDIQAYHTHNMFQVQ